jgi:hypothetical protein
MRSSIIPTLISADVENRHSFAIRVFCEVKPWLVKPYIAMSVPAYDDGNQLGARGFLFSNYEIDARCKRSWRKSAKYRI